jgi:NAD(P)-dependent dehydrogenase (short-subunit alcohol dehydrogenase family)
MARNATTRNPRQNKKIAVVTGASGGVGRATAIAFAERGFDVALLARGNAGLQGAAHDVESRGARALCCPVDVAEFDQVDTAADRIESELGPIDVWVNDAMTTVFSPFATLEPADFKRAVEVTFLGQVWGTKAALDRMRPRDRGSIVNVGSALAFIGIPLQTPYCASKFACRGFFESVRAELIHDHSHIRLSMVHLPAVNTPQFDWCKSNTDRRAMPVPPIYQPEVPARYIVDVALDGRRAKVLGSWNKLLVWAAQLSPSLANQYAAIGAWDAQLTDEPRQQSAPVNLMHPCDDTADAGAHGRFDDCAGGFLDPAYLRTLPTTVRKFGVAVKATFADKMHRF